MKRRISDPDVRMLADTAATLESNYVDKAQEEERAWADSPFHWIRKKRGNTIAKIGKELIRALCAARGLCVVDAKGGKGGGADLVIEGHRVRLKRATLSEGKYIFNQIRDEDFEYLMCLGLSPFDAHCWVIPKHVAIDQSSVQSSVQHGPRTDWTSFSPAHPPAGLRAYGGTISEAFTVLQRLTAR